MTTNRKTGIDYIVALSSFHVEFEAVFCTFDMSLRQLRHRNDDRLYLARDRWIEYEGFPSCVYDCILNLGINCSLIRKGFCAKAAVEAVRGFILAVQIGVAILVACRLAMTCTVATTVGVTQSKDGGQ